MRFSLLWILQLSLILVSLLTGKEVSAQPVKQKVPAGSVRVVFQPLTERTRPGAPLGINLEFENYTARLLEGTLIIEGLVNNQLVYRHLVPDLVLTDTNKPQTRHILLPIQFYQSPIGQIDLQMYLETEDEIMNLEEHPIRVHEAGSRNFAVGVCVAEPAGLLAENSRLAKRDKFLSDWIAFQETGVPQLEKLNFVFKPYRTSFSTFSNQEFPVNPLELTTFDVLFVWEEAYRELKSSQLESLEQWVQAGGTLLLIPDGKLEIKQLELLNRLCARKQEGLPYFSLDEKSILQWNTNPSELIEQTGMPFLTSRCEMGRVAILSAEDWKRLTKAESNLKRRLYYFLWNYRETIAAELIEKPEINYQTIYANEQQLKWYNDQIAAFDSAGKSKEEITQITAEKQMLLDHLVQNWIEEYDLFPEQNLYQSSNLFQITMPQEFQMVPPILILGVMIGYLLVVGPGDFYFLGMYKKRKWTWFTFPIMTIGVTLGTLWLVNSYMKVDIPESSVTVVDIGSQGQVLRSNSLECYLSQRPQARRVEVEQELMSPIGRKAFKNIYSSYGGFSQWSRNTGEETDQPMFVGNVSGKHELVRQHKKWTPEYAVRFSIAHTPVELPEIPWNQLSIRKLMDLNDKNAALDQLDQILGETSYALFVMNNGKTEKISRSTPSDQKSERKYLESLAWQGISSNFEEMFNRRVAYTRLLTSVTPRPGEFGNNLVQVDSLDSDQWCLLLVTKEKGSYVIQRRILTEEKFQL